jgi:hypothetical protein
MTPRQAQAALDRRAAAAVLAGAAVGQLPLLWLIREALDDYLEMLDDEALERDLRCSGESLFVHRVPLLTAGGHTLELRPDNGSRLLVELDSFRSTVRAHEVPNAALVLHDAVKADAVAAEGVLRKIESATGLLATRRKASPP